MKFGRLILTFLSIILIAFLFSTACNDSPTDPDENLFGVDVSSMYQDSILFLTNRFSNDSTVFNIAIINADGSGMHVLFDRWNVTYANWSLKTGKIYFAADMEGNGNNYRIYCCDMQGKNETLLYSTPDYIGEIKVSPEGTRIVFMLGRENSNKFIMLNVSSLEVTELTDFQTEPLSVSWSPDASTLAFASKSSGNVYLKMFNLENMYFNRERVFIDMVRPNNYVDWSWASDKIAMLVNHYNFSLLYCYDHLTRTDYQLTAGNFVTYGISWSQSGERIIIAESIVWTNPSVSARLLPSSLYIFNVDGTNKVQLTDDTYIDKYPCWQ